MIRSRRLALVGTWERYNLVWTQLGTDEVSVLPELPDPTPSEGKRKKADDDDEPQGSSPQCPWGPSGSGGLPEPPPEALAVVVSEVSSPLPRSLAPEVRADDTSAAAVADQRVEVSTEIDWGNLFLPPGLLDHSPIAETGAGNREDLDNRQDYAIEVVDEAGSLSSSSSSEGGDGGSCEGSSTDGNDDEDGGDGAGDEAAVPTPLAAGTGASGRSPPTEGALDKVPLL
ncbi:hypothetical protein ABZP36_000065 [Zizania latifolia]